MQCPQRVVGVAQVGHLPDDFKQQVNSLLVPAAAAAAAAAESVYERLPVCCDHAQAERLPHLATCIDPAIVDLQCPQRVVGVAQVGHLPDHLQQQVNSLLVPAAAAAAAE
jgi:hypothetical protein